MPGQASILTEDKEKRKKKRRMTNVKSIEA